MNHHIQIARGTATRTRLALARQLDPLTVRYACWDASGQPAAVHDRPFPVTGGTRIVDDRPGPVAVRAGFGECERTLVPRGQPGSLAHRAVAGRRPRSRADPVAGRAGCPFGDAQRHSHSGDGVGEANAHLGFQVRATHGPRAGAGLAAGAVEQATEEVAETA